MFRTFPLLFALTATAAAQVAAPAGPTATAVVPASTVIAQTLPQLSRTAENTRVDLASLRIDRWKGNNAAKQDASARAQSIQRNLTEAMPALIQAARQNPQSVNAAFKLYRNLNALYDVMSNLAESAGAFGPQDQYQALARDVEQIDQERRALGDALESATAQQDAQIARVQQVVRKAETEAATPPKKIVIDDDMSAKPTKSTKKKAAPKKKPAPQQEPQQ